MSALSNVNSNELIQRVVGKFHPVNPQEGKFSQVGFTIVDNFRGFFAGLTKEGKAQTEMRNGLQGLVIQINAGTMDGLEATVKAFSARVNSLDSSLTGPQVASLFKEAMNAVSTDMGTPITLTADRVEQFTREIDSALGATVTSATVSFTYKKAAVAVAALAVLGLGAYFGTSALLASPGEFFRSKLPVCFANEPVLTYVTNPVPFRTKFEVEDRELTYLSSPGEFIGPKLAVCLANESVLTDPTNLAPFCAKIEVKKGESTYLSSHGEFVRNNMLLIINCVLQISLRLFAVNWK